MNELETILTERFPVFSEPELQSELLEHASLKSVPAGTVLMEIGAHIHMIPIVLEGSIKVLRQDDEGKEILLYYLMENETCAMTLTCCMHTSVSGVRAVAESDLSFLAIPHHKMESWMWRFQSWKAFVMRSYQARFDELLRTIDQIAFSKMDERLWQYLLDKVEVSGNKEISVTHLQIAQELGTSREVVSRLLKQLERMERVRLGRNLVEVL